MARNCNENTKAHRYNLFRKSPSVQQLREEVRKQFKEKLQSKRSNELYKRRDLFKSIISDVQKHFSEVEESLLNSNDDDELNIEAVIKVLMEVENELYQNECQKQVEKYSLDMQEEINAYLKNFSICSVCDKFTDVGNNFGNCICNTCSKLYFNNETL